VEQLAVADWFQVHGAAQEWTPEKFATTAAYADSDPLLNDNAGRELNVTFSTGF
jgi:hypothetical protein